MQGALQKTTKDVNAAYASELTLVLDTAALVKRLNLLLTGNQLSDATVARMTSAATPIDQPDVRGLGWDIDTTYSANRGELFPIGSFGHTGFTGTSIWIDPQRDIFIILLSNRVNPTRANNRIGRVRVALADAVMSTVIGNR